jgi:hypothetical protein
MLACLLIDKGELAAAEGLLSPLLAAYHRQFGPEHPSSLATLENLASVRAKQGDASAAEDLFRQALGVRERIFGPHHPHTSRGRTNLGLPLAAGPAATASQPSRVKAVADHEAGSRSPSDQPALGSLAAAGPPQKAPSDG